MDAAPRRCELAVHGHEESIEDVDWLLSIFLHEPAVETSTQLDKLVCLFGLAPELAQLVSINTQLFACVHGVISVGLRLLPSKTELLLELVIGHIELGWLQDCCL